MVKADIQIEKIDKQLKPGYIKLLSVANKTLRTISHITMLFNSMSGSEDNQPLISFNKPVI